jgi:hypothetical protein
MAEKPIKARSERAKRTPINGRNVLTASNLDPNYKHRFVNDMGDRVESFKERGWELVDTDGVKLGDRRVEAASTLGSKAQVSVDKSGTKAFLMRIPKDWYEEDQQDKARSIAEQESAMKQQALANNELKTGKLEITRG